MFEVQNLIPTYIIYYAISLPIKLSSQKRVNYPFNVAIVYVLRTAQILLG